jgi:two-component system nitrogen regulation response regulator GlnG
MKKVLIIDDEEAVCWALQRALTDEGYAVTVAPSAEEGLRCAREELPDAVILDVRLPGMDGLTALVRLRQLTDNAPVIVVTAFGNLDTAVRAVEGGAFDYLAKPFDLQQALEAVNRALCSRQWQKPTPAEAAEEESSSDDIVGRSLAMQAVFKRIALAAPRDA